MKIRRRVLINGRAQGVGFRASTLREALRHPKLTGFVRNLANGQVEAVFEGDSQEVLAMVKWCEKGPRSARVDRLETLEEEPTGEFSDFSQR